jgi:hypothetical protein
MRPDAVPESLAKRRCMWMRDAPPAAQSSPTPALRSGAGFDGGAAAAGNGRQAEALAGKDQQQHVYTAAEVNEIVQRAVQEREEQLRAEFATILTERLAEQFESFTRFNQDYIERNPTESSWSYIS